MNAIPITEHTSRSDLLEAGARAAREGLARRLNPLAVGSEAWMNWMDGYDHQAIWTALGRGKFPSPRTTE